MLWNKRRKELHTNVIECPETCVDAEQLPMPCSAAKHKSSPELLLEALVLVWTIVSELHWVSTYDKMTQKRLALVVSSKGDVLPGGPFGIKIASWSKKRMKQPIRWWWHSA